MVDFLYGILFALLAASTASSTAQRANINLQPRQRIVAEKLGFTFHGNRSQPDHFKLLEFEGDHLLVGARNAVYNLSASTLELRQKLEWSSSVHDVQMCKMKGKSEDECNNYIRVLVRQRRHDKTLVCGTNAFKPTCRSYGSPEDGEYKVLREFSGVAISPFDPRHNSTAFYVEETDELYAGTVSDFTATDPLIYRRPLAEHKTTAELRSPHNDLKVLNDPNFVASFDDDDRVYMWFRETAAEYAEGKVVYGRVGRVCKRDQGGSRNDAEMWTSFLKARLNCSLPADIPFYFNELQAATSTVNGRYATKQARLVYAIFTTPRGAIQGSAVCAFDMNRVREIFDESLFRTQTNPSAQWLPLQRAETPSPRPGNCAADSKKLADKVVNFVKRNSLMAEAVPNFFEQPLIVDTDSRSLFTQIAVHAQVETVGDYKEAEQEVRKFDVVFIGTDNGRVLKVVNSALGTNVHSVLIESIQVFSDRSIDNLLVRLTSDTDGQLIVVSRDEVRSLPLHHCANATTCSACVRLQDPYCAWNLESAQCVGRTNGAWSSLGGSFVQNVLTGRSQACPEGEAGLYTINDLYTQRSVEYTPLIYNAESMAIAIVVTLAVASVIGFAIGYRMARMRMAVESPPGSAASSVYDAVPHSLRQKLMPQSSAMNGHGILDNGGLLVNHHVDFAYPPVQHAKLKDETLSLVVSVADAKPDKNAFVLNNGTLPKDYKTRKVYL